VTVNGESSSLVRVSKIGGVFAVGGERNVDSDKCGYSYEHVQLSDILTARLL